MKISLKNIHVNPIMKKDLRIRSRSMKFAWGLFAFEAVLGLVFFFAINLMSLDRYGYTETYKALVYMFPVIGAVELGILSLIIPIETASAITSEREKQTFDILLTTVMTPMQVIRGKVNSATFHMMIYIIASIPLMAVAFTVGGLSWWALLGFLITSFIFAYYVGSIGILCSTLTKKSIGSIVLSYVFMGIFFGGSWTPMAIILMFAQSSGVEELGALTLLFNPAVSFVMFFMTAMGAGDEDIFGGMLIKSPLVWMIVSFSLMIGLSLLFQWFASTRIDPVRGYKEKSQTKAGVQ